MTSAVPAPVRLGVILLGLSFAIGTLDLLLERTGITRAEPGGSSAVSFLIGVVITAGFAALIWMKHDWARWVLGGLTVLGVLLSIPMVIDEFRTDPVGGVSSVVQLGLQSAAVLLFFSGPANDWFKTPRSR